MKRQTTIRIVWVTAIVAALAAFSGDARAGLLLNEVLADPARDWTGDGEVDFRDDEWIEVVNSTASTLVLDGYRIAAADTTWRYEFSGELAPFGARRVTGVESLEWERDTGHPAFGFRLSNAGGEVALWRLTDTDTVRVDAVVYSDEAAEDDRSWGRLADDTDEWVLFDGLNPYEGDPPPFPTGCDPTPGTSNECVVPVLDSTWTDLKDLYGDEEIES